MDDSFLKIFKEQLDANKNSEKFQDGKTRAELQEEFKKVRYLQDITATTRYAKTSTSMNPLGGLWS